ncbi:HTH-type transcriptional regulator VirS [compost metagenome]
MTALVRTSAFVGFNELVNQLGGQPEAMLQRFRVDPRLLLKEDAQVPLRALVGVLEYAAQALDCPDFGLRMAEYQDLQVLGPVALIARSSATVGQALEEVVRFIGYHSPGFQLDLDRSETQAPRLLINIRLAALPQQRQMLEVAMGVVHNTLRLLCGPQFAAQAVLFSNLSPLPQARYQRYFKTSVYTGQACNAMVLREENLSWRIEQQDPHLHRALEQYLSHIGLQTQASIVEQVELLILRTLPTQRCRLPLIAEQLGQSERSLQRHLAEAGYGFDELLERLRRSRAELYLAERNMPLAQVAGLLGYSEQSVFNRACRRWFAMTPSALRRQLLAAAAALPVTGPDELT